MNIIELEVLLLAMKLPNPAPKSIMCVAQIIANVVVERGMSTKKKTLIERLEP